MEERIIYNKIRKSKIPKISTRNYSIDSNMNTESKEFLFSNPMINTKDKTHENQSVDKQYYNNEMNRENTFFTTLFNSQNEKNNQKNKKTRNKKDTHLNGHYFSYAQKLTQYQKKREENILNLKNTIAKEEREKYHGNPKMTKKSQLILQKKEKTKVNFFERIRNEEKKTKENLDKLKCKIKTEREERKREEEKPIEYNIKNKKPNKKFLKAYEQMMIRNQNAKEKRQMFSIILDEYKMKECKFQPEINKNHKIFRKNSQKRYNSIETTKRLCDDEMIRRKEKKNDLLEKYKYTFRPKINEYSRNIVQNKKRVNKSTDAIHKDRLIKSNNNNKQKK